MMPANALFLTGIIAAFAFFAMVLSWGEHQTRSLKPNLVQKPQRRNGVDEPIVARSKVAPQRHAGKVVTESTLERAIVQI